MIRGEGYAKIASQITDISGKSASDVLRIVRTEGHRAQSAGRLLAFEKSEAAAERLGIKTARVWVSTKDERTRDQHISADGREADKDGMFDVGGEKLAGPGLGSLPENNINCRCTTKLSVKKLPQSILQS